MVYSRASNLSHRMWKFSLFSQHYYSVYKSSTYDVFCLSIFIASFLAIKSLWAVLYTSEQVCWPDGCSNKWGEMSEAFLHSWAVRRTSPAPRCQHRPPHTGAEHDLFLGMRATGTGQGPALQGRSLHWGEAAQHCLSYLAVSMRPGPESQILTKMFSVFASRMAHAALAMNTSPKMSKIALNGKLLIGFQNPSLTMLHLISIISSALSTW